MHSTSYKFEIECLVKAWSTLQPVDSLTLMVGWEEWGYVC